MCYSFNDVQKTKFNNQNFLYKKWIYYLMDYNFWFCWLLWTDVVRRKGVIDWYNLSATLCTINRSRGRIRINKTVLFVAMALDASCDVIRHSSLIVESLDLCLSGLERISNAAHNVILMTRRRLRLNFSCPFNRRWRDPRMKRS